MFRAIKKGRCENGDEVSFFTYYRTDFQRGKSLYYNCDIACFFDIFNDFSYIVFIDFTFA